MLRIAPEWAGSGTLPLTKLGYLTQVAIPGIRGTDPGRLFIIFW